MTETPNPHIVDADTLTGEMRPIRQLVVSLGSNLGERIENLQGAVRALADTPDVWVTGVSPVYETEPVDAPEGSDNFLNAVVLADTTLAATRLMDRALAIEDAFDRQRSEVVNAPRTLDVDLIVLGDRRSDEDALRLPHPRAAQRAFVLRPWLDVDPGAELLGHGPVADLLAAVGEDGRRAARRPGPRPRVRDRPTRRRPSRTRTRSRPATSRPTPPGVVTAWGVVGLVGGWLVHPLSEAVNGTALVVSWVQPGALLLLAADRRGHRLADLAGRAGAPRAPRAAPRRQPARARPRLRAGRRAGGRRLRRVRRQLGRLGGRAGRPADAPVGPGGRLRPADRRRRAAPRTCVSRPKGPSGALASPVMSSPSVTQATRRRQRSTRVTVAVGLILLAALGVTGAAAAVASADVSWMVLAGAAALAVLLGAVATRITHSELADSRRAAAADRAELAQGYSHLTAQRATEHAAYVATIESRINEREQMLDQLEMALSAAQRRAATATRKKNAESRRAAGLQVQLVQAEDRATDAMVKVHELEQELVTLRAELDSVTAAWHAAESVRRHAVARERARLVEERARRRLEAVALEARARHLRAGSQPR